jgi:hypothetical protein
MGEAGGVDVRFPVNVLKPLGLHRHCSGTAFAKVAVDAVEHQGRRPSDQISCPSDRVRKCGGGGIWHDERVGLNMPPGTPFIWRG